MSDIIPTIEQLIESFDRNGMEKFASELKGVKAALGVGFRPKMERKGPARDWQSTQPGDEKFDRSKAEELGNTVPTDNLKLDQVIERFIKGVRGELGTDYFRPRKEAPESLRVSDFDRLVKDEKGKKIILDTFFKNKVKKVAKSAAFFKVLELSDEAKEKGFDAFAKRLKNAAAKMAADVVEKHDVLSIEEVFETSSGPNDLVENLKKALNVYEGASGVVKLFFDTYKKNPPKTDEGVKDLVRKTDKMISMKFNELNKIK